MRPCLYSLSNLVEEWWTTSWFTATKTWEANVAYATYLISPRWHDWFEGFWFLISEAHHLWKKSLKHFSLPQHLYPGCVSRCGRGVERRGSSTPFSCLWAAASSYEWWAWIRAKENKKKHLFILLEYSLGLLSLSKIERIPCNQGTLIIWDCSDMQKPTFLHNFQKYSQWKGHIPNTCPGESDWVWKVRTQAWTHEFTSWIRSTLVGCHVCLRDTDIYIG